MIGGLSGGKQTDNFEFSTGVEYSLPEAAQPDISENASVTAPVASHIARDQKMCIRDSYTWDTDTKTGKKINRPIDDFNHLMDAMRYAFEDISRGDAFSFD